MSKITVTTPEYVELEFELAGLGSRFFAIIVDYTIQAFILLFVVITLMFAYPNMYSQDPLEILKSSFAAILIVGIFLIVFGYFIFFETIWGGQTPGKRLAQIQVVKDTGEAVGFMDALLRNIFRVIDFLPFNYLVGVVFILLNNENKRVGDFIAHTIVVKLKQDLKPMTLPDIQVVTSVDFDITRITEEEYSLIRNFLIRRGDLDIKNRQRISFKIAEPLFKKLEISPQSIDDEELLEIIATRYKEHKKLL
ncbi:MAG: RDD family protein [Vulcanimicrobiota bacterium]